MREIALHLRQEGLIKSVTWFKIYSLVTAKAIRFKPGLYSIASGSAGYAIADILARGVPSVAVVVREGATVIDIDRMLASAGVITAGQLIEYNRGQKPSLEGFLFPDTYRFSAGSDIKTVVNMMRNNFDTNIGPLIKGLSYDEWYAYLIIASLVEKEARTTHDRALAAGVIRRRLRIGMALQIDAATVYAKCKGAYMSCPAEDRVLTKKDLATESLYNTYLHQGLPPTPIANPSKDAFNAAMNPKNASYLYYISNPKNGELIFALTLDEHNENRKKYHVN